MAEQKVQSKLASTLSFENIQLDDSNTTDTYDVTVQLDANSATISLKFVHKARLTTYNQTFTKQNIDGITSSCKLSPTNLYQLIIDYLSNADLYSKFCSVFLCDTNTANKKRDEFSKSNDSITSVNEPNNIEGKPGLMDTNFADQKSCLLFVIHFAQSKYIQCNYCFVLAEKNMNDIDKILLKFNELQKENQNLKKELNVVKNELNSLKNDVEQKQQSPIIYGYADRDGSGHQSYTVQGGSGGPIIWTNVTATSRCNIGNMLNLQNGRFTAPINGIYTFTVSAWLENGDPKTAQLWYNYNDARQQTFTSPIQPTVTIITGSLIIEIKKHDYIDFRMYQPNGGTKKILENFFHTFVRWALIKAL